MRIRLLLMTLIFCVATTVAANPRYSKLLDSSQDQIVKRVVVPSAKKPQGEVQLIQRGELLVVQTLLASRIIKRVVAVIDTKEQRKWPETRDGYIDSVRYREELFRATRKIWKGFKKRSDKSEIRQYLVIEFILGPDRGLIALSEPQVAGEYGQLRLVDKKTVAVWPSSNHYMTANIKEIIRDSFKLDAATVEKLLEPLWPLSRRRSK